MTPVFNQINDEALKPYLAGRYPRKMQWQKVIKADKGLHVKADKEKGSWSLFIDIAKLEKPDNYDEIPTIVLISSFVVSELKTAFQIGFVIYIPFLIIDMVVASVLLSMGMMMLPPFMVSLPFKLMLFVLIDGWNILVGSMVKSFL
jgi:flagellar biosynthetic protein FliP